MSDKMLENDTKNSGIGSDQSVGVDDGPLFHVKQNERYIKALSICMIYGPEEELLRKKKNTNGKIFYKNPASNKEVFIVLFRGVFLLCFMYCCVL